MEPQLSRSQLDQVIAEAQRLSDYRQDELLSTEQVREILQELNLPPTVLEDALMQVHRRQVLEKQTRRRRFMMVFIGLGFGLMIAIPVLLSGQHRQAMDRVGVQQDALALGAVGGPQVTLIERQAQPQLYYRVTLKDAPMGQRLPLSCDWINPVGQVVQQNRYDTQPIKTAVWPTHCRYTMAADAPLGLWKVKLFLDGRLLEEASFEVK